MWRAYTDGSASPNPGPGGAGSVILCNDKVIAELVHTGGNTTNNRMELYALIMTYPHLPTDESVTLYTDSQYVQKGLTEWIHGWIKRNWQTSAKKPVKNKELWQQLIVLRNEYPNVKIEWIKAHNGHKWNERADELANRGTERSKQKSAADYDIRENGDSTCKFDKWIPGEKTKMAQE
uniref:ribonuclease H n=1 Tax=Marseillevirus LCMAC202 TaxID=2506606 RepID=A0A481YX99_9VIRU|nr:MAG: ribonuclease H [Marseillevirus LCMAC202]